MSNRLDQKREKELEPERMLYAVQELYKLGIKCTTDNTKICFQWKGSQVTFYPYSGWHTGKSIKDGRGLQNLINQLKCLNNET